MLVTALLLVSTAAFAGLHTRSGTVYVQNGQWNEAIRELKLALADDPKDDKAHFMIGVAYSNLDSVAQAYEHFMKAKELEPKKERDCDNNIQSNYAKHYKLGQTAFAQANFPTAAREFLMSTMADPRQSGGHYNLAVSYSRLALTDSTYHQKALAEADKVLELTPATDPNHMHALQLAANTLVDLGKPAEAVARMQKTIDEDPSKYQIVEDMGNDLMGQRKWAGAALFLKLAAEARAKVSADDAGVLQSIGVCEFNLGKKDPAHLDEAIVYYQKALDVGGDNPDTVYNMMAAYALKPDWENAALWGEKYVSLAPSDPKGWQLLARSYGELGQDDKAADALAHYSQLKEQ